MVVCRYYVNGCCKFGNNCRFEHPKSNSFVNPGPNPNVYKVSGDKQKNEFLQTVSQDLNNWINTQHQWKLSCYSPFSISSSIPVFEDFSVEEVRFGIYNASKTNTILEATQELKNKEQSLIQIMNKMISPNQDTRKYLLDYYDEAQKIIKEKELKMNQQNPFGVPNNPGGNLFANIMNKPNPQPQSTIFNSNASNNNQNLFQKSTPFGGIQPNPPTMQQFQQPPLQFQQQHPQQFLQQPPQQFQPQLPQQPPPQQLQNLMTASSNNFMNKFPQQLSNSVNQPQSAFYSAQNDLNEEDMKEYSANEFTLGQIPHIPPTENLVRKF